MTSISIQHQTASTTAIAQAPPNRKVAPDTDGNTHDPVMDGTSPLLLEGWLEFNRLTRGLDPRRFHAGIDKKGASIDAVIYLDKKGRVRHPWRNPYLPVSFHPTATGYAHRVEQQWHEAATQLVREMRERGVANTINLPPDVQDVRPWLWAGYRIGIRYTYFIDFPYDSSQASKHVRRRIRRCEDDGFRAERTLDLDAVYACLRSAEERQGYQLGVSRADLSLVHELMGDEHFHAYVAYAPDGEAISAAINLVNKGGVAIGWVNGTRTEYLSASATSFLEAHQYTELERAGATGLDLCGANLPSVSVYKASLGARLVPYYTIEPYNSRKLAAWAQSWWRFHRQSGEGTEDASH